MPRYHHNTSSAETFILRRETAGDAPSPNNFSLALKSLPVYHRHGFWSLPMVLYWDPAGWECGGGLDVCGAARTPNCTASGSVSH